MSASVLRRIYHLRGLLASPPVIFAMFCTYGETEEDWLIWPLGGLLVALGVAMRVWAQEHIRFRLRMGRHLATTGPYALVRNPLYIGNTLMCLGAVVASELLWMVPVTLVWCAVVYSLVVRQEEARLLRKYGEPYQQYLAAVPRWFPRTQRGRNLALITDSLRASLLVELPCLLILLPFVLKEILPR